VERTDLSFSQVLEQEVQEWKKFQRALRKEDQQFLDRLFEKARLHIQAGGCVSRPWPFETILISILLEHEKALVELRSKMREKIYDCGFLLSRPQFHLLASPAFFNAVRVDPGGYGISWSDDIDLSEYELWTNGKTVVNKLLKTDMAKSRHAA